MTTRSRSTTVESRAEQERLKGLPLSTTSYLFICWSIVSKLPRRGDRRSHSVTAWRQFPRVPRSPPCILRCYQAVEIARRAPRSRQLLSLQDKYLHRGRRQ